jgi:TPR repeat protein
MAARYGDKYSQHRLSLIYWHGVGAAKDRVEAYVWADLAAERGYPSLLAIREKMWNALTLQEREAVPDRGKRRFAKYGDAAAMSLFRGMLARQRARHFLLIRSTVPSKLPRYYAENYLAQENASWKEIRIDIGDIETDSAAKAAPAPPAEANAVNPSPAKNDGIKETSKSSPN